MNKKSLSLSIASIPGPDDITRVQLPNGIIVLTRPNFNSSSVTISGSLAVGSLFDKRKKLGLSDFTASALMRGTQKRDFQNIYHDLESVGASLGISGGTHTSGFSGRGLAEDLDLIINLAAESFRYPVFPAEQIERLRAQILTGLALREQNTGDRAAMAFDEIVYAGHPYSLSEEGYPDTVQAITQADMVGFHAQHYGPQNMRIAIVGAITPEEAIDKVTNAFEDWSNQDQKDVPKLPTLRPLKEKKSTRVTVHGKSQSDLVVGTAGPMRSEPNYLAALLGNNIFGQFGMMGRIGSSVREKAGLAYYVSSSLAGGVGPGPWSVFAGVNPANEAKAVNLIFDEFKQFVKNKVTEEELADSKANFIGRMPLGLESNAGVASSMLYMEKYGLGLDYYQRYPTQVAKVTREDIRDVAVKYLTPDLFATAIAGPPKD
jgi:zinc protease